MSLGPRACAICGPKIQGCWRCTATLGHVHLDVVSRTGRTLGRVASCGAHAPASGVVVSGPTKRPAHATTDEAKRRRDRERRKAQRVVLDRHQDEVDAALAEIRGAA